MWKDSRKSSIKVQAAYEKEAGLPGCFSWVVLPYQPSDTTVFLCWYCSITCMAQAVVLASADYQAVWLSQGSLLRWRERKGGMMFTAKWDFCQKNFFLWRKKRGGRLVNALHFFRTKLPRPKKNDTSMLMAKCDCRRKGLSLRTRERERGFGMTCACWRGTSIYGKKSEEAGEGFGYVALFG